jgi:hypothetical protein
MARLEWMARGISGTHMTRQRRFEMQKRRRFVQGLQLENGLRWKQTVQIFPEELQKESLVDALRGRIEVGLFAQ